jgi:hypothetical protein
MKMATVLESSEPVSMIRRQRGMISVESRKLMTSELSFCCRRRDAEINQCPLIMQTGRQALTLTRAPMTPSEVNLRYSNGLVLLVVFKKG